MRGRLILRRLRGGWVRKARVALPPQLLKEGTPHWGPEAPDPGFALASPTVRDRHEWGSGASRPQLGPLLQEWEAEPLAFF